MNLPRNIFRFLILILLPLFSFNCKHSKPAALTDNEIATSWAELTLYLTQYTPANSPTFASRALGYIGLTMYESVVPGFSKFISMQGQLNGLDELPKIDTSVTYNWQLVLNAGQAEIIRAIYIQTSDENKTKIDSLETSIYNQFAPHLEKPTVDHSVAFGKKIANAIFKWSKTDGGHKGYLFNFDKNMVYPNIPGSWKPPLFAQSFSHYPLHPHWGENRTFVIKNSTVEDPHMLPYDTVPGSLYYQQFERVYKKDQVLTKKEKEAAIWWGDDPDVTFTPPGHSYYIATIALKDAHSNLMDCAMVYAQTGMALADAFIKCWGWKYQFFTERPNTFIPKFIDQEWESFWPDPPFPAFPSGHAIQASAAATILTHYFGNPFHFTDRSHEGRERDEVRDTDFVVRSFDSFWDAAQETADSRFYGGIHTPLDNQVGLEKGREIANNVLALQWKMP